MGNSFLRYEQMTLAMRLMDVVSRLDCIEHFSDLDYNLKGEWQQKFLSSYLKETPKKYIEVYYRIFISALFGEIF